MSWRRDTAIDEVLVEPLNLEYLIAHLDRGASDRPGAMAQYLRAAVDDLEPRLRRVIEALFYEQKRLGELARELGISRQHAWNLKRKAIRQLKEGLCSDDAAGGSTQIGSAPSS